MFDPVAELDAILEEDPFIVPTVQWLNRRGYSQDEANLIWIEWLNRQGEPE